MANPKFKPIPKLTEQDIERFWSKVDKRGPDECWPWKGSKSDRGWGTFQKGKQSYRAHRICWFIHHGEPGELECCHSCDNRPCCNEHHLFRGSHIDNMTDMRNKKRGSGPKGDNHWMRKYPERIAKGEHHPQAKINQRDVDKIRQLVDSGVRMTKLLARDFGITYRNLYSIARRETWN